MTKRMVVVWVVCAAALAGASPAEAQYGTRRLGASDAVGENYVVELGLEFWKPTPDIQVSSESLGIAGTTIDAVNDLGFEKKTIRDWRLVLRPSRKFKFRLGYTPIRYQTEARLTRPIVFNGQRYDIGLPVNTDFDWKVWKLGIEYDFLYASRGFVGFIADVKYTNARIDLVSPLTSEFSEVTVPVPTIGVIGRGYVAKNVSITGELTGLKITYSGDHGKYIDFDLYGTANFTDHLGAQLGYRSLNIDYSIDKDLGTMVLKGVYFGGVVRF